MLFVPYSLFPSEEVSIAPQVLSTGQLSALSAPALGRPTGAGLPSVPAAGPPGPLVASRRGPGGARGAALCPAGPRLSRVPTRPAVRIHLVVTDTTCPLFLGPREVRTPQEAALLCAASPTPRVRPSNKPSERILRLVGRAGTLRTQIHKM